MIEFPQFPPPLPPLPHQMGVLASVEDEYIELDSRANMQQRGAYRVINARDGWKVMCGWRLDFVQKLSGWFNRREVSGEAIIEPAHSTDPDRPTASVDPKTPDDIVGFRGFNFIPGTHAVYQLADFERYFPSQSAAQAFADRWNQVEEYKLTGQFVIKKGDEEKVVNFDKGFRPKVV